MDKVNSNDNGTGKGGVVNPPTLTITVSDAVNFSLNIGGEFPSLDYALNMLAQATREFEAQWRLQRAALYQQQQIAAAQEAQVRADLLRRH